SVDVHPRIGRRPHCSVEALTWPALAEENNRPSASPGTKPTLRALRNGFVTPAGFIGFPANHWLQRHFRPVEPEKTGWPLTPRSSILQGPTAANAPYKDAHPVSSSSVLALALPFLLTHTFTLAKLL
ncbi:hypothetical protein E4U23_000435, partial [Claviceps purpurea]